jgi:hypothetical protein
MAVNYFIGWNVQDLETELRAAQEDLATGRATIRTASGDVGQWSQVENSLTARIAMLLQALNRLEPVRYPIGQVTRSSEVRLVFNSSSIIDPASPDAPG